MRVPVVLFLVLFGAAHDAAAQSTAASRWGIAATVVPQWEFLDFMEDAMDRSIEMTGRDLHVGIVRGRPRGDEWGAAFIARTVRDDSTLVDETPKCVARAGQPDLCARGIMQRTRGVRLRGLLLHRFFSLGSIAGRVQVGATLSGGVARLRGEAEQTQEHLVVRPDPSTGQPVPAVASETAIVDAREIFDHLPINEYVPMGGVEGAVAVVVAPNVKLRFSAGANFPAQHRFALTAQYFF